MQLEISCDGYYKTNLNSERILKQLYYYYSIKNPCILSNSHSTSSCVTCSSCLLCTGWLRYCFVAIIMSTSLLAFTSSVFTPMSDGLNLKNGVPSRALSISKSSAVGSVLVI